MGAGVVCPTLDASCYSLSYLTGYWGYTTRSAMSTTCDIRKCKRQMLLSYAAFGAKRTKDVNICEEHWTKHCDDNDKFDIITHFFPMKENNMNKDKFDRTTTHE